MKAIVTGANGFVGSNLVKKLLSEGVEVLAVSLSFENSRLKPHKLLKTLEMDVQDIKRLGEYVDAGECDLFYHFAWQGSAGAGRGDAELQVKNAMQTLMCLQEAANLGCKKFICAGSIMEYESNLVVYAQGSKPGLAYIYGAGKTLAHELCKPVANSLGIDLVWAYITNAYGVGENSPRFINTTLCKIINGDPLEFTSGTQNYDFVYIDDVANAFYLLGLHGKANKGYVIGSGHAKPLREFVLELCQANAPDREPLFGNVPFTGVNVPLEVYSIHELESDCVFTAEVSFAEGTKRTLDWLRNN